MTHHVYRCYAADGDLLYVGCTVDVERRMYQHERSHRSWVGEVARYDIREFDDHEAALAAEAEAIASEHPYWNHAGRWRHHATWSDENFQRWGHMLAQHPFPKRSWWNQHDVKVLHRAYLMRFGRPFPENPTRGFAHTPSEVVA